MGVVCLLSGMGCCTMTLSANLWGGTVTRHNLGLQQAHMWSSFRSGLEH